MSGTSPNSTATWETHSYDGRWVYRDQATTLNCGAVYDEGLGVYLPDTSILGCRQGNPTGNNATDYTQTGNVRNDAFGIRVFSSDQISSTMTEHTQCAGCSTTPTGGGNRVRVTVLLPPRGTAPNQPPRKIFLMPVIRPDSALRPRGAVAAATEFSAANATLTGESLATDRRCLTFNRSPSPSSANFICTSSRFFTQVRYLRSVKIENVSDQTVSLFTGTSGTATAAPAHLVGTNGRLFVPGPAPAWSATEADPPGL